MAYSEARGPAVGGAGAASTMRTVSGEITTNRQAEPASSRVKPDSMGSRRRRACCDSAQCALPPTEMLAWIAKSISASLTGLAGMSKWWIASGRGRAGVR